MGIETFVPIGFVPLANWDNRHRGKDDGHSVEWKLLGDAAKAGKIPGMKLGGSGRWFVHERSAVDYLQKIQAESQPAREVAKPSRRADGASDAVSALTAALSAVATNQTTLIVAVERIAHAVERMADQHEQQTLAIADGIRVHEAVADCSTNGFHS